MLQHYTTKSGMPKQWHELTNRPFPFGVVTTRYFFESLDSFYFVQAQQRRISHEVKAFSFDVSLLFSYRFQRIPFSRAYIWRGVLFLWSGAGGNGAWFLGAYYRAVLSFPLWENECRLWYASRDFWLV
jgi:hypothetical protein